MQCEKCRRPYGYNQGKLHEFYIRPWTWGYRHVPEQRVPELRWLCQDCERSFDLKQEGERISLVQRVQTERLRSEMRESCPSNTVQNASA